MCPGRDMRHVFDLGGEQNGWQIVEINGSVKRYGVEVDPNSGSGTEDMSCTLGKQGGKVRKKRLSLKN